LLQKFDPKDTIKDPKDNEEVFELFSEDELDNNFDELTFRVGNVLNEMLVNEDEDSEIESYAGEYDHDIEIELEQDNNRNDNDDELEKEKDEIIPDDGFVVNEGSISKKHKVHASVSPCVIIDNIQGTIKRCGVTYKLRKLRNLFSIW